MAMYIRYPCPVLKLIEYSNVTLLPTNKLNNAIYLLNDTYNYDKYRY